jgi:hypothetical protein
VMSSLAMMPLVQATLKDLNNAASYTAAGFWLQR